MFIDHLELLQEKTRGNLSKDEEAILKNILSELQMNFVQVQSASSIEPSASGSSALEASEKEPLKESVVDSISDEENKKRFSKSYGA